MPNQRDPDRDGYLVKPGRQRRMKKKLSKKRNKQAQGSCLRKKDRDIIPPPDSG